MAMQSGVGLSKILVLAGAGYTGTILFKNGKLSDIFGELQALVKGLEKSGKDSEGETDHAEAIAAQVRRLAMEVRQLASSRQITVLNGNSGQMGNLTSMVVPAAAVGALGYGYMWWKGIAFSDLMYVTKRSMANAVTSLTQNLEKVTEALSAAKKHLTQRMENLDGKMDDQRELSREIRENVSVVRENLNGLGYELDSLQKMVSGLDWRMGTLEFKQDWANEGVRYLCHVASGQKVEMPKLLQEQIKVSGTSRGSLTYPDPQGLKEFADAFSVGTVRSASDAVLQDHDDRSDQRPKVLARASSTRC
ncbi:uncharacterized protein LOC116199902 [Punica granatum]|uniref:Uncharacterized protein LOC116199902 n=1 Tax=Punica granatum TaxID=22663 RepID=A0A6P8CWF1_PUNGR|nr:uncharacterized protein LOC116199902 [Punica granatum]